MPASYVSLGITEAQPGTGNFKIEAINVRTLTIDTLNLTKDQIREKNGISHWDLGYLTEVDCVQKSDDKKNITYSILGKSVLKEKVNLKEWLEDNLSDLDDFLANRNNTSCIIKVEHVDEIEVNRKLYNSQSVIKCRLAITCKSKSGIKNTTLLNKDYRWITYWSYILNEKPDYFNEAKIRYQNMLNDKSKDLYLVLYRYHFKDGFNEWITGIHFI